MRYDKDQVIFLDTETTGLYPWMGHEVWEIGYISWTRTGFHGESGKWSEFTYAVPPQRLDLADPTSLRVCRFYERTSLENGEKFRWNDPTKVARILAERWDGKHVIGAIPSFDIEMLRNFFMVNGQAPPTVHYHLIDVEAMALGFLAATKGIVPMRLRDGTDTIGIELPLPWKSEWLMNQLGIKKQDDAEAHTAIGDARKVKEVWERMIEWKGNG